MDWARHVKVNTVLPWPRDSPIYQEFKSTDIKYKTRLRSRISNLKDQKKPRFTPERSVWQHRSGTDRQHDCRRDGKRRAERDQESADQGVHSRAPAFQSGRHRDWYVCLRQVQGKELHLHSGPDTQRWWTHDHLRAVQRVWKPVEVLLRLKDQDSSYEEMI